MVVPASVVKTEWEYPIPEGWPVEYLYEKRITCLSTLLQIPEWMYPCPVFAHNPSGLFSAKVSALTKGQYGHFMWLVGYNEFISQSWTLGSVPVVGGDGVTGHYSNYFIKVCYNPVWTAMQRQILIAAMRRDLVEKHWWSKVYDVPQILGHAIGLAGLQIPGLSVCSDRADYLRLVDGTYNLKYATPTDVNLWMKAHMWKMEDPKKQGYLVLCRFMGGD